MAFLDDHPNPNQRQQRERYDEVSGVLVVHTAESMLDSIGVDTGAEGVANYIAVRTTPGSYHRLADSDSIVAVARFEMCTYGDGTGSNEHAIHISFACRAADWPTMSAERKMAFIRNGAEAAAEAYRWVKANRGIVIPARRITRAESDAKVPGFISHGERDPGRRTDPGPAFPWDLFLSIFAELTEEDPMADYEKQLNRIEAQNKASRERDQNHRIADRKIARAQAEQMQALGEAIAKGDQKVIQAIRVNTNKVIEALTAADEAEVDES